MQPHGNSERNVYVSVTAAQRRGFPWFQMTTLGPSLSCALLARCPQLTGSVSGFFNSQFSERPLCPSF